jgi:L-ribulose-5-phosphate 3-epimerase
LTTMNRIKIGVRLESFGLPLRRALQQAEQIAVGGVQVDAVGDLSPDNLSQTGRREFLHLLRSHNLELTALGCPLRHGLDTQEHQDGRIDRVRKVMTLSFDLGPRIAIVQAGRVPAEDDISVQAALMTESLTILGYHGDRTGSVLALETGLESGAALRKYLDRFDTGGLGVNLDPANLLMHDFDPYESTRALQGKVIHCHAKDARKSGTSRTSQEVALGAGDIDWMHFLSVLEEIEYRGWLVAERESGGGPQEMADGVGFLRRFIV